MLRVGFFRELPHGYPDGLSFGEVRGRFEGEHRRDVVNYLNGGTVLASSGVLARDEFNEDHPPIGQLNILTDGTWVWPSDLAYYLEQYGVSLPAEFLSHAAQMDWTPPRLARADLLRAEEEFLSG